jgi:hypothetical protein
LVEIAVQVKLQQIGRIIRRLASATFRPDVAEVQFVQIERIDIGIDRPHRIVPTDVILYARRKQAHLLAVVADLVAALRQATNCIL